jgi:N-terminal acetyltransferase B complex catalytic subunit
MGTIWRQRSPSVALLIKLVLEFQLIIVCRKRAYFVDLFVRVSNQVAINMYKRLGYIVYRTVLEYYSGDPDEDAFGKWVKTV